MSDSHPKSRGKVEADCIYEMMRSPIEKIWGIYVVWPEFEFDSE